MAEWKIRRGESEWPVESIAMLQEWARSGRISGSDYIFNPILDKWMYAADVLELQDVMIRDRIHSAGSRGLDIKNKTTEHLRQQILVGVVAVIIGVALLIISPKLVISRGIEYSSDTSVKDLAFFGGITALIIGGIIAALGLSKLVAQKE